jgi:hypothetical protein
MTVSEHPEIAHAAALPFRLGALNVVVSHTGKLWDIMGLYGRQETGPNPPRAHSCGRSTLLTVVKLKETLPIFGRAGLLANSGQDGRRLNSGRERPG